VRLRAQAPAKINLCLFLGPVRDDGCHELVTLFESLSLADTLTLETGEGLDQVVCPGVEGPNLVSAALAGLRERGWDAPPVRVEIVKRIPVAGGMGGGSADAAAALRLATELAPGRPEEIYSLAALLGADVPSQLAPGLVMGTGAGELVEPFEPLAEHAVLVIPFDGPLSTPEVFREADRLSLPRSAEELRTRYEELVWVLRTHARPPDQWLVNDLEPAALSLRPSIAGALEAAGEAGADRAIVCGSGPTVAGIFWGVDAAARAAAAADSLAERFPGAVSAKPVGVDFGMPLFA
jgi:4-diphosphocytidyl-2-C-methyl-D-erythritol kinase